MSNLNGRVKRLEQHQAEQGAGDDVKIWAYWDDYSPEERARMEGKVNWIIYVRPEDQDNDQS